LNAALAPDRKCLDYLQREFGREILNKTPLKVLPKNKKLSLRELVTLFRYHYWHTWEKKYSRNRDGSPRWPKRRDLHCRLLHDFRKLLVRYGFDGYGNPSDENGIVVFAEDRLHLKEVIAQVPPDVYTEAVDSGFDRFRDVGEIKDLFRREGSQRAKALSERVAAAEAKTDNPRR
jgi:hypothetical protein